MTISGLINWPKYSFGLLSKWVEPKFKRSSFDCLHLDTMCFRFLPPLECSPLIIVLLTQPQMPKFKFSKFWSNFVEVNRLKWIYECAEAVYGFNLIKKKKSQGRVKFEEIVSAKLRLLILGFLSFQQKILFEWWIRFRNIK